MELNEIRQLISDQSPKDPLKLLDRLIEEDPSGKNLLFEKANILFQSEEFSAALECYEAALSLDPHNLDLLNAKYETLKKLSRHDEYKALEHVIRFLELDSPEIINHKILLELKKVNSMLKKNPKNLKFFTDKAFILLRLKKLPSAVLHIREFGPASQSENEFSELESILLSKIKEMEQQLADTSKALEENPYDPPLVNQKIMLLAELEKYDDLRLFLQNTLKDDPDSRNFLQRCLEKFSYSKNFDAQLAVVEQLIELEPTSEKFLRHQIFALNELGRFNEALVCIHSMLEKNPEDDTVLKMKLYTLCQLEPRPETLEIIERLLKSNPGDKKLLYSKISTLNNLHRYAESLPIVEELEKEQDSIFLVNSKIFALNRLGRYSEALEIVERLLEDSPENKKLLHDKVSVLISLGRYSESLEIVEKFLAVYPDDISFLYSQAYLLAKLSRYLESANLFEHMFDKYPNDSFKFTPIFARILHSKLPKGDNHAFIDSKISGNADNLIWFSVKCKLYFLEQKFHKARKIIEENEQLVKRPEFKKDLALYYESTYEIDKAISLYTSMLETDPSDVFSLFGRCQTYIKKRMYDLAMQDIQKAHSINPSNRYKQTMAFILGITGRYDEAMDILKTFSESGSDTKSILRLKAAIHRKNKDFEASLGCYNELLKEDPNDTDGLMGTALVHEDTEQYDLALRQIDRVLEQKEFSLNAMRLKASILAKIGSFIEAREMLDVIIKKTSDSHNAAQTQPDDSIDELLGS